MNANSIAQSLSGNLTYDQHHECGLDRLTAVSLGSIGSGRESHLNSLGKSLIAFKLAHRPDEFLNGVKKLGSALVWRQVRNRGAVAKTAITEWVVDQCQTCWGATETADHAGVVKPCLACNQTGKRKYGDDERKGIPGKGMQEAHLMISLAVSIAVRGMIKKMGRE